MHITDFIQIIEQEELLSNLLNTPHIISFCSFADTCSLTSNGQMTVMIDGRAKIDTTFS